MKQKKLIIIISVALIAIAAWVITDKTVSTISNKEKSFAVQDTANITKIFMADKFGNSTTLNRSPKNGWLVENYLPATPQMINTLLETIYRIRVKNPVSNRGRNTILKRLASNSVKVEIYQNKYRIDFLGIKLFLHEKLTKTYYVGGATQDNLGTHMLLEGADNPFVVDIPGFRGYVASRYTTLGFKWRVHDIFSSRMSKIKSVEIDFIEEPEMSYTINKVGDKFSLEPKNQPKAPIIDSLKMLNYLSSFSDINFEAFLNEMEKETLDSIKSSTPFHIVTLVTTDGDTTELKTYHKYSKYGELSLDGETLLFDSDRFYGDLNGKDFVLLQFFTFDKILRPLTYFALESQE